MTDTSLHYSSELGGKVFTSKYTDTTTYVYVRTEYPSLSEADQGVLDQKNRLNSNPNDWCIVQSLGGSLASGWVVPMEVMTDEEINALSGSGSYSVSSIHSGHADVGLTAAEATEKVAEHRSSYIEWATLDKMVHLIVGGEGQVIAFSVHNVDMSEYVS